MGKGKRLEWQGCRYRPGRPRYGVVAGSRTADTSGQGTMKIVCISDTHSLHRRIPEIPDGDILIHAGDSLGQGTQENLADLNDWLGTLPHRRKIVIAGNHDWVFQEAPELARETLTHAIYLEESGVELEGLQFWGSPWTPQFLDWAFMLERGQTLRGKWQLIPKNTDVL